MSYFEISDILQSKFRNCHLQNLILSYHNPINLDQCPFRTELLNLLNIPLDLGKIIISYLPIIPPTPEELCILVMLYKDKFVDLLFMEYLQQHNTCNDLKYIIL